MAAKVAQKSKTKKQPVKRRLSSSAPKKTSVKKRPVKNKPTKLVVSLRLTRKTKIVATFTIASSTKKKSRKKKSKKYLSIRKWITAKQQLLVPFSLIVLGIIGSFYFSLTVFAAPPAPVTNIEIPVKVSPKKPLSLPPSNAVRLRVPSINIDAPVEKVDKDKDGQLEVPANYNAIGQYGLAPTPGEIGPSILTGHLDNIKGPAVFWRLRELKPGQRILVYRADGKTARFKVTSVKEFRQDKFPTQKVYGNIDHAGIRLITCGGNFNILKQRYSTNVVVYGQLVKN